MDGRRIGAAAGAVGLNALIAGALIGLADAGPQPPPAPPALIARLIEPPRALPAPPKPLDPPPPVRAPQARPAPAARMPSPVPSPLPTPATPAASAPAPAPLAPMTEAVTATPNASSSPTATVTPAVVSGSAPGPTVAPSSGSTVAALAGPRRAGPRLDASWAGNMPPAYPASARRLGEQGEVRLDVHVGADGSVLDIRLRASSGSPALDRSAMEAVRRWRFSPATVDGEPVAEWYRDWKWVFRLEG